MKPNAQLLVHFDCVCLHWPMFTEAWYITCKEHLKTIPINGSSHSQVMEEPF